MKRTFTEIEQAIRSQAEITPEMPVEHLLLARLLLKVDSDYLEHRNKLLKKEKLNHTLFEAMLIIYAQPEQQIQPSRLSDIMCSSRTNATRVSDELVAKGWVERLDVASDRRAFMLRLTTAGREFLNKIFPKQWELVREIFSILSVQEVETLKSLLLKVDTHLDKMAKHKQPK